MPWYLLMRYKALIRGRGLPNERTTETITYRAVVAGGDFSIRRFGIGTNDPSCELS
jgi:hypothetical protein